LNIFLNKENAMTEKPILGVIGGSGLYQFSTLEKIETMELDTPFGKPSSPIILGTVVGKKVAFLARHGIGHIYLPSEVNYRANIYAMKMLGVERIISVSACGSLREDYSPGEIVIPDQLVDFTKNRPYTYFGEGFVAHVGVAEPFCNDLRQLLIEAVKNAGAKVHSDGTYITIEGPRFSTKAESNLYRQWGMSIIGMTAIPEAILAREAEICYATMAHVTDYDVWHKNESPVTVEMVIKILNQNTQLAQKAIVRLVEKLPEKTECECGNSLADAILTQKKSISLNARNKLDLLIKKYID
jgi:5'-methylthioadenosine phosphorylase